MPKLIAMRARRLIGCLLSLLALAACGVPPQNPEPPFAGIAAPRAGAARFYLLRPAFSDTSRGDSPLFSINGKDVMRLSANAYTDFNLQPGTYRFALRPARLESSVWQGEWKIDVEAGKTYFFAIWNEVEQKKGLILIPSIVHGTTPAIPWIGNVSANKQLRYEVLSEKDALQALPSMRYLKPEPHDFAPQP